MAIFKGIKIISGGQTGVDRAALDFAISNRIPYGGWCPKSGWAEDLPEPPGLLAKYPLLKETLSNDTSVRTHRNVKECGGLILFFPENCFSPGTELTIELAFKEEKPYKVINPFEYNSVREIRSWLYLLKSPKVINIAGPRESECPGIYEQTLRYLTKLFTG